ncbi:MAG: hypothetical protein ACO1SX_19120 [Actinomycetota bacterium]
MPTTILELQNAWADGETLPDTWLEAVANALEAAWAAHAVPSLSAAVQAGDVRTVTLQLQDLNGDPLAVRREVRLIVCDSAYDAECASAPSGGVDLTGYTIRETVTADKQLVVLTDANGELVFDVEESTAKTFYIEASVGGRVASLELAFT